MIIFHAICFMTTTTSRTWNRLTSVATATKNNEWYLEGRLGQWTNIWRNNVWTIWKRKLFSSPNTSHHQPYPSQQHVCAEKRRRQEEELGIMENVGYLQCVRIRERETEWRRIFCLSFASFMPSCCFMKGVPIKTNKKKCLQSKKDVLMSFNSLLCLLSFFASKEN